MSQAVQPMYASRNMREAEMAAWFQQHSSTPAPKTRAKGELPNHDS
ncbi:hypothetical protein ACH4VX_30900 [Streptomyces sp. NPDC020731]